MHTCLNVMPAFMHLLLKHVWTHTRAQQISLLEDILSCKKGLCKIISFARLAARSQAAMCMLDFQLQLTCRALVV